MATHALQTRGLTRRFGELTAVDSLSLDVPQGGVVGLVGPNGSGKSTLIRMLLGLIRPSHGTAHVLGAPVEHPTRFARRVGALVESPAFLPSLTARRNLRSLALLRGLPATRVDEVLEVVGLSGREDEPVRRFSLGMKQRLGIAAALLPDPELLLLDEPTNGLDPAGIVEIRSLLRALAEEGRTVVVSSHLLAEIQAACDWIVVIRFGELLFAGPMAQLLARADEHVLAAPEHPAQLQPLGAALEGAGWTATPAGGDVLRVEVASSAAPDVNRVAAAAGITLRVLTPRVETLEDVFLHLTGTTDGELAASRAAQAASARGAEVA
jgi:ABC-2 type transport system ATP-binding protein